MKFSDKIVPSNLLTVEIPVKEGKAKDGEEEENPRIEITGRLGRLIKKVIGENFTARVNKLPKAAISCIELIIADS